MLKKILDWYESLRIFNYDSKEDALRVSVPSQQTSTMEERLVYEVMPSGFEIRWEYGKAAAKLGM